MTKNYKTEKAVPEARELIKSIAEQGYSLESALADIIDNSISAKAENVIILTRKLNDRLVLYIADDGVGMSESDLAKNMRMPSSSIEQDRESSDLGRFGLGLKTASFSQTRKLTVLSKHGSSETWAGRRWDVERMLDWDLEIIPPRGCAVLAGEFDECHSSTLGQIADFKSSTIVVWEGLYKFLPGASLEEKENGLHEQLSTVTLDYLGLIFHRFLDNGKRPFSIKVNNVFVESFDPFPKSAGLRSLGKERFGADSQSFSMEGIVLPAKAIKAEPGLYSNSKRNLLDLEGFFVYRAERLIWAGGWGGMIPRRPNIQLARIRVELGNQSDQLFELNVAKSRVVIPHTLKRGVMRSVLLLIDEAKKEYFSRTTVDFKKNEKSVQLLDKVATSKGHVVKVNRDHPLIVALKTGLDSRKKALLKGLLLAFETAINNTRRVEQSRNFVDVIERQEMNQGELKFQIETLKSSGLNPQQVRQFMVDYLGLDLKTLPLVLEQIIEK